MHVRGVFDIRSQEIRDASATPSFASPIPGKCRLFEGGERNGSPSQANVMRLARVIIEPESGRELVEFVAADSLRVSFVGQRKTICAETTGLNDALTNR